MEKITNYVENLFFGFPRTEEVAKIKMQIIDSLVEKYHDLINSGKNENEAFGILISELGNMNELKKEFNIPDFKENKNEPKTETQKHKELSEDVKKYREDFFNYQKKFAVMIGLGVVFCITGIVISASSADTGSVSDIVAGFFLPVAIGVFLFIIAGVKQGSLKKLAELDIQNEKTQRSSESISSIIMLIATMIFILLGFLKNAWHPAWVVFPIGGVLCAIIEIIFANFKKR
ncbi:MAG: hypothetical protein CR988_08150 [Treponema sp.]|nr:MAG: hypothetical protein CR988_08150 [Treponema sp.]